MKTYTNLKELLDGEGFSSPFEMGRRIYKDTDCGPWISFELEGGKSVYYGDKEARELGWLDQCTGIQIGSIVEGSDVEIGPDYLEFPITSDQLWEAVEQVNKKACDLWEEANSEEV